MTAGTAKPRNAVIGEHRTDVDTGFGTTRLRAELLRKDRAHGYVLGPLKNAREAFAKETKLTTLTWPDDEEEGA
jgi:hypothetical protein